MYRQFNIQKLYVLPTQCIYVFCVDLRTNSDYFTIRAALTDCSSHQSNCHIQLTQHMLLSSNSATCFSFPNFHKKVTAKPLVCSLSSVQSRCQLCKWTRWLVSQDGWCHSCVCQCGRLKVALSFERVRSCWCAVCVGVAYVVCGWCVVLRGCVTVSLCHCVKCCEMSLRPTWCLSSVST